MSPTLVIILIIVVWLIVLAPLLLRGQRPIHKTGEAFDETRVLFEGGTGSVGLRRQPRLRAEDVRAYSHADAEDYEVVEAEVAELVEEDVLIEEPVLVVDGEVIATGTDTPEGFARTGSTAASSILELAGSASEDRDCLESVDDSAEAELARGGSFELDDSYSGPADLLHPAVRSSAAAGSVGSVEIRSADLDDVDQSDEPEDLSVEEVEFARRRSGRGGWDPDLVAQKTVDRYARRRRTLIGLTVVVGLTLLLAFLVGGWMWAAPVVAAGLTAAYLGALRTQVRQENELRALRIRHLRRARLGVRQSGVPVQLRHPAGTVLEVDDQSPDFYDLATTHRPLDVDEPVARRSFRRVG